LLSPSAIHHGLADQLPCQSQDPGLNLDQLDLFEGKFVPTGLALMVPIDQLGEDPDNPRKAFPPETLEDLAQDIV